MHFILGVEAGDCLSDGKKECSSPFKKKRGICFILLENIAERRNRVAVEDMRIFLVNLGEFLEKSNEQSFVTRLAGATRGSGLNSFQHCRTRWSSFG